MLRKFKQKGFTLLEILIVVALLGALIIGVLATIDPLEQIKKGTDTVRRNTSTEIYNAMISYYSINSSFPWTADVSAVAANAATMTDATGFLATAVNAGELKPDFVSLAGTHLGRIFLTSTDPGTGVRQTISVCFLPEAKSFTLEDNARYNSAGDPGTTCVSTEAGGVPCYWCVK